MMRIRVELQSPEHRDQFWLLRQLATTGGARASGIPLWVPTLDGNRWHCTFRDADAAANIFLKLCASRLTARIEPVGDDGQRV
jgi:hypothetical protein